MDSMRHLSTSLPTTARRRQDQPELLQDFKAAALSVTNLYKTAAASHDKAKATGYQDALDDLLAFLDKENLGLMDGEGWRVRQWATERLVDDAVPKPAGSDDGAEGATEETRSSSPEVQRKTVPAIPPSSSDLVEDTSPRRSTMSEPPQLAPAPPLQSSTYTVPSTDNFAFRSSSHTYPTNHDRDAGMEVDAASSPSSPESVRIVSRPIRGRHTNHNRQRNNATSTLNINLGLGASAVGSKRKAPHPDFSDIWGFNGSEGQDRRDGGGGRGGGKRGRHV